MELNEIWMLLLGWFLGLLAPLITNLIQEKKKAKLIKKSILSEIDEFRIVMASLIYKIELNYNAVNHDLIEYLLPIYKNYNGLKVTKNMLSGLEEFKKLNIEQLNYIQQQNKDSYNSLSMKKYDLPYLKTKINELSILDNEFQRNSLELLFLLGAFNEEVDESRFFYKLTFDGSISNENHKIASEQLDNRYISISQKAMLILKKTDLYY